MNIELESGNVVLRLFFIIGVMGPLIVLFWSADMTTTKARTLVIIAILSFGLGYVFLEGEEPEQEAKEKVIEYFEEKIGEKVDEINWIKNHKVIIKTFEGNSWVIPINKNHKGKWIMDSTIYKKGRFQDL